MVFERALTKKIAKFNKSLLLLGPRQTGKSTLIQNLKPDLTINLANEREYIQHLSSPELLEQRILRHKTIFIDEVQRIPSILNTVQYLIDKNKQLQFYLTGSSARKLKRGQANLLPGRILIYELGPLTYKEVGSAWDVYTAMAYGLLPGISAEGESELREKILSSYSLTYLKEEIQAEALTRNIEGFSRFFKIISGKSGEFMDFTKISSLAMVERTSVRRYFEILTDTMIMNEIEAFAKGGKRRLKQHSKYYFFDTGVLNGVLENFKVSQDRVGLLFEHLVLQLIHSGAKANDEAIRVSVYHTEAGSEVDFILEKKNQVYAIEVKATQKVGSSDLRGLKSFSEFYRKPHKSVLVYLGAKPLEIDGVEVLPISHLMDELGY